MRWTLALVAAGIVLLLAFRWASSPKPPTRESPTAERGASSKISASPRSSRSMAEVSSSEPSAERRVKRQTERRAGRDRVRAQIREASRVRRRGSQADEDPIDDAGHRRGRSDLHKEDKEDDAPTPGDLKDRTGNHGYLLKVMNEELMPLADECYALARHDQPELAGLLVLDVEIVGDEEIGGIIEGVEPGEGNELIDPALLECMRESLFATTLPPPEESGRDALSLSMPLSPDEG